MQNSLIRSRLMRDIDGTPRRAASSVSTHTGTSAVDDHERAAALPATTGAGSST